jgi:hypothetical protein
MPVGNQTQSLAAFTLADSQYSHSFSRPLRNDGSYHEPEQLQQVSGAERSQEVSYAGSSVPGHSAVAKWLQEV